MKFYSNLFKFIIFEYFTGDMVTANTRPDVDNRVKDVHFQCSFGGASKGWIRTGLEPNKVFNDIYQLNQTGIKVGGKYIKLF